MRRLRAALAFWLAGAGAAAGQDPQLEPLLVELQLGRITSRTVPAYRNGDAALIPLYQFFDLAEIRAQPERDGGLAALLQPGNVRVSVRPARREVEVDGRTIRLFPPELVVRDGEIYLSSAVLGRLFQTQWEVNWQELTVTLVETHALPIARRIQREALAAARLAPEGQLRRPELLYPVERPWWDGAALDYSFLVPSESGAGGGAYSVGGGLDLLGGSLPARVQNDGPSRAGRTRVDASWSGVWRGGTLVRQLRLGDGISTGPRFRSLRGVALTNAPFTRPAILGDLPYAGTLGPGWQVEAYRGGRLIAFDSVNTLGQYTIDVPLQYGENPVDFVAYGPFGEVRQFNRTYRVATDVIPAGRVEYGLSAGECRVDRCAGTANLDLRVGIARRWTVSAGVDRFWRDGAGDLTHPYAAATGGIGTAIGVQVEAVKDAVVRGALRIEPHADLQLSAEFTRFARGVEAPILTPEGRRRQVTLTGFWRPFTRHGAFFLDGVFDRAVDADGTATGGRLGASLQRGGLRLLPSVRVTRVAPLAGAAATRTTLVLNSILLPLRGRGLLDDVGARTTLETGGSLEPETGSAFLNRRIGRWFRAELGAAWSRGSRGATLTAFLAAELPGLRASSTVTRPAAGEPGTTASHFVQGALIYDRGLRALAAAPGPALARGGLSGRVFMDLDDDGVWSPREPVIRGVRVQVGIGSATSSERGEYRIWDVTPWEPTYVTVDTTTLPSPLWVPAHGAVLVEPNPNRFRELDIPILPGGVIEGSVLREGPGGERPVPAAELVLRHLKSGTTRRLLTFGDGSFYLIGVRPGEYELALDPGGAARRGLAGPPVRFRVPASIEGAEVSGLALRVR